MGIDVSFWQDDKNTPEKINWKKAKSAGAVFAFIKGSQSTYTDRDFVYNWNEAKNAGIIRGAYHFYDYQISPSKQADYVINLLKNDPGELPPVMDLERHLSWPLPSGSALLNATQIYLTALNQAFGRKPLFYTNPNMIYNIIRSVPDWLTSYPLWIAHYYVSYPTMISPWKNWTFWQWTPKGDGLAFGMESKELDMNWFNGSVAELRQWASIDAAPPTTPLTLEQKVEKLWHAHPELH
jgi:lysozyme